MRAPFGVYVHVPFCAARCDYCAFATWTDRHHLHERYVSACIREIAEAALPPATSVFFGGGTPSLLPPELLVSLLDAIPRARGAEITVECNPETVTPRHMSTYARHGVNRLSFGVQSMVPSVLAALGRRHDPASVRDALRLAHDAGIGNCNVDLIYGAAGESVAQWRETLDAVLTLDPAPTHVSAYALTVEPGTALAADPARHPDDDDQAEKYLLADDALLGAGLVWYEISNWAVAGRECRHNLLYWQGGEYRGIGCAAHSHVAGRRWWNRRTPERYMQAVEHGEPPIAGEERLDAPGRRAETFLLSLRTAAGAAWPQDRPVPQSLDGLVVRDRERVRLTPAGRLLASEVAVRLVDAI